MTAAQSAEERLEEIANLYWAQEAVIDAVMQKNKGGATDLYHLLLAVRAIHERIGEFAGAEL